jgi:hypothetical protein
VIGQNATWIQPDCKSLGIVVEEVVIVVRLAIKVVVAITTHDAFGFLPFALLLAQNRTALTLTQTFELCLELFLLNLLLSDDLVTTTPISNTCELPNEQLARDIPDAATYVSTISLDSQHLAQMSRSYPRINTERKA